VRELELDITVGGEDIPYQAGDVAAIMPKNDPQEVATFLEIVGYAPDAFLDISLARPTADEPLQRDIPSPCSAQALAEEHLDIHAVPKRSFFELMMQFCDDEDTRDRLEYLSSAEASENNDFQVT